MKKLLVIGAAVAMLLLSSCGKTGICEGCGKEGSGKEITYEGETAFFCDECAEGVEALLSLASLAE